MRIPTATYRIQFHGGFNFEAAKQILSAWECSRGGRASYIKKEKKPGVKLT